MAGIAQNQVIESALADVQGQVLGVKLENENSFLVYGIEIVTAERSIMEVKVDAGSGKVLAMERDKVDNEDNKSGEPDNDLVHKD